MAKIKVIIMGAAGRDFHNFNLYFRDNEAYRVVAFTATQIPDIEGRVYPAQLAGALYPQGIPIHGEENLEQLIKDLKVDQVIFAYSDMPYRYVMSKGSQVMAAGADFRLMGPGHTMLKSKKPVISITAARTGVGKSQATRRVCDILTGRGLKVVVVRHPMPYGDLAAQACQRFADYDDLDRHQCTIEEREEYEPHIDRGIVVYAGVDYRQILTAAEKEADLLVWDGGNNDFSFFHSDLYITLVDPHRPGHELGYHPGETNVRLADVVIINKVDTADWEGISRVRDNVIAVNPRARILEAASPIFIEDGEEISGKKVLVIEDGPTLTHGEMDFGAGTIAAQKYGAAELLDARPFATGTIKSTYASYPHIGALLPAMGYGEKQVRDLEETINRVPADLVISATPIDLRRIININKPCLRVRYELQEIGLPTLSDILEEGDW